ncbi:isochorismatase family protein [Rhizobium sp. VS19-DR104.2]|uniref:isochorismatase family protein n=1 Tax=unclassified Rhizobium TaxID=2613769 RepID=UPI001CC5A31E|nr:MULTISPECIES: isochorismatase family protein [unclassified Rhizobium]MBZ5761250.1 isochorismatase family protein [Rhizobium sp. VS19-DR96]MBZ5767004.1 isochorismatase family protein [Rhizobium sp. VS19-DR129.2]MBZ5774889.1 isochorismatase family protein [Rhizobium sp. VS19-DRK62.2]MBZ5785682.1 isochorismatase family protein [Rhizobium sp. VS19-DR121]MBZ5803108.1 isochorismatase family protein [Rhizobium sp. VS19-DR181]
MSEADLHANYAKAYDNRIGFGRKPALVLVDFVQAYFEPDSPLFAGVDAALESALRIRAVAHGKNLPVILTGVVLHPSGLDGGRFFQKAKPLASFTAGNPLGAWPKGLEPRADEFIVTKQYPSAFFGTSLASMLTAMGVDNVILTGLTTSGCVRASCVDAMSHGFITTVVRDACGDRHPAPHEANLFDMNAKYADVVSEAEILAFIGGLD